MTINSKILDFFRNSLRSEFFDICLSKLDEYKSMFFLGNKKGDNKRKQLIKKTSGCEPLYLHFPLWIMFFSAFIIDKTAESFVNPLHKFSISVNNLESWEIVDGFESYSSLDVDRSFSIDNSCKVCQLSFFPHASNISERAIYGYAERLNPETSKEDVIV